MMTEWHVLATRGVICFGMAAGLAGCGQGGQDPGRPLQEMRGVVTEVDGNRSAVTTPAAVGARVALVIGNAAYEAEGARLTNPVNDARAVAAMLRELAFDVIEATDVGGEAAEQAVDRFVGRIDAGDEAVFYYSGHGMELPDGMNRPANYLLPVDTSAAWDVVQTRRRSLSASEVQERMDAAGARVRIVILDACRDNPFDGRSLSRGLGPMQPRGGLVAFAAQAGRTASDNAGMANGLFTTHLLEALEEPGVPAALLFEQVGAAVEQVSGGRQRPAYYAAGAGDFVFRPRGDDGPPVEVATTEPAGSTAAGNAPVAVQAQQENLFWESIRESPSPADFEAYLRQFPDGMFRALAANRLEALRAATNRRVALAVGNGQYGEFATLRNPANDALDVSAAFERLGFEVTLLLDATRDDMNEALLALAETTDDADIAAVFYSGIGMQLDGVDWLLPIDVSTDFGALDVEAVSLDRVVTSIAGARVSIGILDVGFEVPSGVTVTYGDPPRRDRARPWRPLAETTADLLLAFGGAADGGLVLDGDGRNGTYTEALLEQLEEPGVEVQAMLRRVRDAVVASTGGVQSPRVFSTLTEPVVLLGLPRGRLEP